MTKVFLTHHLENSRCEVALVTALATVALATAAIAIDALPMDLFSAPPASKRPRANVDPFEFALDELGGMSAGLMEHTGATRQEATSNACPEIDGALPVWIRSGGHAEPSPREAAPIHQPCSDPFDEAIRPFEQPCGMLLRPTSCAAANERQEHFARTARLNTVDAAARETIVMAAVAERRAEHAIAAVEPCSAVHATDVPDLDSGVSTELQSILIEKPTDNAAATVAAERTFAVDDAQDVLVQGWFSRGASAELALEKAEAESAKWKREVERLRSCIASARDDGFMGAAVQAAPLLAGPGEDNVDKLRGEITRGFGELALAKHEGREPKKKHSSPLMRAFMGILLHHAGPRGISFITNILPVAEVDTMVLWRQNAPKYMLGLSTRAIEHNFDNCVEPAIKEMGLQWASWVLGEDGSSGQKAIVIQVEKIHGLMKAVAYGLDGDPVAVETVAELAAAIRSRGLATTLYVIMLIPLVYGAPAIPIAVAGNANKFTQANVLETTKTILRVMSKRGYAGRVRRGVSDGDPKLRAVQLRLMFHESSPGEPYVAIEHAFIQLKVPFVKGEAIVSSLHLTSSRRCHTGHGHFAFTSDWLHITFRHRVMFLTPKRQLQCFEPFSPADKPFNWPALHLTAPDIDYHEKQLWAGCMRWQGIDNNGHVVSDIVEQLSVSHPAAALYWTFSRYFTQIFIGDEPILVKIEHAGWCLAYLALWRWDLAKRSVSLQNAFMSDQTFTDSVIAINNFVLSIKVVRDADDPEDVLAALRLLPSHDSSRFLEYLFNFCRSEHKNATSFSIYAGKVHVDHYLYVTLLEFQLGVVAAPATHRQVPKGPARIDWSRGGVTGQI